MKSLNSLLYLLTRVQFCSFFPVQNSKDFTMELDNDHLLLNINNTQPYIMLDLIFLQSLGSHVI